jgi:hypothetical protein
LKKAFYSFDKSDLQTGIFDGMNWIYRLLKKIQILSCFVLSKDAIVPVFPGQRFACGPQGHTCIPENENGASTVMTGITTSFANHMY